MTSDYKGPVPSHVPSHCVVDWDFMNVPGADADPHRAWRELQEKGDVVWTRHHGGHWIVTRHALIEEVQKDHARFSHREFTLPRGLKNFRLAPIEYDPPEHTGYRQILNLAFSPRQLQRLKDQARSTARELSGSLAPRGACEFMADYARRFPVAIFLGMVDLPLSQRTRFLDWAETLSREGHDTQAQMAAFRDVSVYLQGVMAERVASPGEDVFSQIGRSQVFGRPIRMDEALQMAVLLFLGGLDTVASMMGFIARFLATAPSHRRFLRDHPERIPAAVEELIRRHGLSNTTRLVVQDTELGGAPLKTGDLVMVPLALESVDERRWTDPFEVDFARDTSGHAVFGNGPHKCPGANLARIEIALFLEEWLARIPDFSLDPDDHPITATGLVNGVVRLPLRWSAPA